MTAPGTTTVDHDLDEPPAPAGADRPAARRRTLLAVVAAVVVGLLVGYAGGLLTSRLTRPGDASAEAGFARDMTTHHSQAVEMGHIVFQRGTDPEAVGIGGEIALGQQGEIGVMQSWLRSWELDPTGSQPRMAWMPGGTEMVREGLMPGMATPDEMAALRAAQGRELDIQFLELMIDHHIGGVHMIDGVLEQSDHPEVTQVAQTMKNTQQRELENLRAALERLRG
jgi:uncharacterized protein (DUF305 family)